MGVLADQLGRQNVMVASVCLTTKSRVLRMTADRNGDRDFCLRFQFSHCGTMLLVRDSSLSSSCMASTQEGMPLSCRRR
jgi:hypothetical protein